MSVTMNARLSEKDLAQARFSRAGLLNARSSEILAVANWCISLEARNLASSEIPQHNTFP